MAVPVQGKGQQFSIRLHTEDRRFRLAVLDPFLEQGQAVTKKRGGTEVQSTVPGGKGPGGPFPLGHGIDSG
jgi:hypothetical protein